MPKYIATVNDPLALLPVEVTANKVFESKEEAKQHGLNIIALLATHMRIFFQIFDLKSKDRIDFFVDNHKIIVIRPHD